MTIENELQTDFSGSVSACATMTSQYLEVAECSGILKDEPCSLRVTAKFEIMFTDLEKRKNNDKEDRGNSG